MELDNIFKKTVTRYASSMEDFIEQEEDTVLVSKSSLAIIRLEIILIIWALSIIANSFIIHAIRKCKILNTWENNVIYHVSWCNLMFFVLQPTIHIVLLKTRAFQSLSCFLTDIPNSLIATGMIGVIFLLSGWILINSEYESFSRYRDNFKANCIFTMYVCGTIIYTATFLSCHFRTLRFRVIIFTIDLIIFAAIFLNILRYFIVSSNIIKESKYVIYVTNAEILSVSPLFISVHLSEIFSDYRALKEILIFAKFLSEISFISNPILIYFILFKYNKHFNQVFRAIFRCKNKQLELLDELPHDRNETSREEKLVVLIDN
nr:uncharacterized protein LOC111512341 [Leptinotarsa decemlineata]